MNLSEYKNILIIKNGGIGDMILCSPFMRGLNKILSKDSKKTCLTSYPVTNLIELCPYFNNIVTAKQYNGSNMIEPNGDISFYQISGSDNFIKDFQNNKFDLVIVPIFDTDHYDAGAIGYLSKAKKRIGYSEYTVSYKQSVNKYYDKRFYTDVYYGKNNKHEVQQNLAFLEYLGGDKTDDKLEVFTNKKDIEFANNFIKLHISKKFIVVCPSGYAPKRNFPPDRLFNYIEKIKNFYELEVVILGNSYDQHLYDNFSNKNYFSLCDKTTIRESIEIMRRAVCVISMDSGPAHLASAVDTPVIVFCCHPKNGDDFYPHSPLRFGPYNKNKLIFQPDKAIAPCDMTCYNEEEAHCISQINDKQIVSDAIGFLYNIIV